MLHLGQPDRVLRRAHLILGAGSILILGAPARRHVAPLPRLLRRGTRPRSDPVHRGHPATLELIHCGPEHFQFEEISFEAIIAVRHYVEPRGPSGDIPTKG